MSSGNPSSRPTCRTSSLNSSRSGSSRDRAPREAADRPPARADQLANPFDLLLDVVPGSPVGNAATDPEEKIVDDLAAARSVRHFRMKQDAVDRLGFVPDRRVR